MSEHPKMTMASLNSGEPLWFWRIVLSHEGETVHGHREPIHVAAPSADAALEFARMMAAQLFDDARDMDRYFPDSCGECRKRTDTLAAHPHGGPQ